MNKIKLELKKPNEDGGGCFYRYSVGSFQFWFERCSNGNIYSVNIRNNESDDVALYMFCQEDKEKKGFYYPDKVEINIKHQRFYVEDSMAILSKVAEATLVASAIEEFFKKIRLMNS